jgi:hypothetical protein
MSCYLKISYLNRHRKYRYYKEKPINFQQIRKELLVGLPSTPLSLLVQTREAIKGEEHEQVGEVKMTEY